MSRCLIDRLRASSNLGTGLVAPGVVFDGLT
jgi:hypothetical protein